MSSKNTGENATLTPSIDYSTQLALETRYIVRKIVKIVYSNESKTFFFQSIHGEAFKNNKRQSNFKIK